MNADEGDLLVEKLQAGWLGRNVLDIGAIRFKAGEVSLVAGHNGAGKSTLLQCVSGFLKPQAGEILFGGRPVVPTDSCLLTQGKNLFFGMTVIQNICLGRFGRFVVGRRDIASIRNEVEIKFPLLVDSLDDRAECLSGGMQQMAAVARTLLSNSAVVLLDEPSIGINDRVFCGVGRTIREAAMRERRIVILVEHRLSLALPLADSIFILRGGRVVYEGPASKLHCVDDLREYYV